MAEVARTKYEEDERPACQYGSKCYQKNAFHRKRYKHPSKDLEIADQNEEEPKKGGIKRKDNDRGNSVSPQGKKKKLEIGYELKVTDTLSTIENKNNDEIEDRQKASEKKKEDLVKIESSKDFNDCKNGENSGNLEKLKHVDYTKNGKTFEIFGFNMPKDFYQLHDFCSELSKNDPANALKLFKLQLVGPYDMLTEKLALYQISDREKYLRYWRYYYDPPEFQTVIKGDDKSGLHFGYWRDEPDEDPIFVAKNKVEVDCIIEPAADNIFGTVNAHMEAEIKTANPFEKNNMIRLQKRLKAFASNLNITLERNSARMKSREKKVVTRTFHKAGIVVPYDKKTQLGYRDLAATDSTLKKILQAIESSTDDEDLQKVHLSKLDEIVRLATIACDECDFGTCLELAHDLFASGIETVENTALRMFKMAYTHLERATFYDVAKAHLQCRTRPRCS